MPVAFTVTGLLDSVGIIVGIEAGFGKVTRKVLFRESSAVGKTNVVTVVDFVRTGHYREKLSTSRVVACKANDPEIDSEHGLGRRHLLVVDKNI